MEKPEKTTRMRRLSAAGLTLLAALAAVGSAALASPAQSNVRPLQASASDSC
jgi:hypothetical protein